eukprot:symbB.v1.2.010425.t2/scaffold655.1/size176010/12
MEEWSKGYDAILGFSQGAIMAAALCAELLKNGQPPRFAILISGFGKPIPEGFAFPENPMPIPSLHLWGDADEHIPPWASQLLADRFHSPRLHAHSGHHIVPQKSAEMNIILAFFQEMSQMGSGQVAQPSTNKVSKCPVVPYDELAGALCRYGRKLNGKPHVNCQKDQETLKDVEIMAYSDEELSHPGPGTYERLLALLKGKDFASMTHGPCRTSEDAVRVRLKGGWEDVTLHSGAKAMLLRTPKGEWLLAVLPADCKLSWKKLRAIHGKGTRIATEEEVIEVTGCLPGAVPPVAAAFVSKVSVAADMTLPEVINFNCGLRTRSIQLRRSCYESVQEVTFADIIEPIAKVRPKHVVSCSESPQLQRCVESRTSGSCTGHLYNLQFKPLHHLRLGELVIARIGMSIEVTLKLLNGEKFQVQANPEETIADLKAKVAQARPELPVECLRPGFLQKPMYRDRSRSRDRVVRPPPSNVPDWLADLVPSGNSAGGYGALQPGKPLEVPQSLVPILTDAVVKQISEQSGASITLRQDTRNLGYSLATQKGREAVQKCCGLTSGHNISKTLELYTYHSSAFYAMDEAMKDFKHKIAGLPIKMLPPETLGAPFKVTIGPGQVAHVSTAEAMIRKTLREVELELHYKQRRTVPAELKHAMLCKNTKEGLDCPNKACPFCHSADELEIASRCCFENSISIPGMAVTGQLAAAVCQKLIYSGKILADEVTVQESGYQSTGFIVAMATKAKAPAKPPAATPAEAPAATPAPTPTPAAVPPADAPLNEASVQSLCEMGFPRDQVEAALRASPGQNTMIAVEFLMTGIPEAGGDAEMPAALPFPYGPGPGGPGDGGDEPMPEVLSQLRNNPQFLGQAAFRNNLRCVNVRGSGSWQQ